MYNLPYFKEQDAATILKFIKENPFAFLCGCDAVNNPVATQVPVFIDEKEDKLFLSGHIMRNTDHHKAFVHNPNVLAVFTGAHTYVSASWYSDKQQASTWNYISVHAKGKLKFLEEQALLDVLKRTTNHFENNPHSGSNFEDLPRDYVQRLVNAIVAFEVDVYQIENVFKLSQNRDEKSYHNIIGKLEDKGGDGKEIAAEMKRRTSELFREEIPAKRTNLNP
ncbi:MAG TPA: FMN-binding negative transcriptional regulator [Chitinophagaceae bacterium]|nr:FMN-binding negative transcriptional regulator [Chitinophagaceae bacterium]